MSNLAWTFIDMIVEINGLVATWFYHLISKFCQQIPRCLCWNWNNLFNYWCQLQKKIGCVFWRQCLCLQLCEFGFNYFARVTERDWSKIQVTAFKGQAIIFYCYLQKIQAREGNTQFEKALLHLLVETSDANARY